jgi:hypothetical protein
VSGLLQDLSKWLQPEEYIQLLQWMLKEDWPQGFLFRSFLAEPPPLGSKPLTWKLLDLLEAKQAYITCTSGWALRGLLSSQPLSASEFLSALERFAHHQVLVQMLSSHPTASSLTSAEVLGELQRACSTGNSEHVLSLCNLPSAKAVSAAELLPILKAAALATDNTDVLNSLIALPAAKHMTAATALGLLMSAISAIDESPGPKPCHQPSGQQLSMIELGAALWPVCGVSQAWFLTSFVCSLPAAQLFSPMDVAAALHSALESNNTGTAVPGWIVGKLCELPGAKKLGTAQVQGLLEAANDFAAATILHGKSLATLTALCVRKRVRNLPAARQFWTEAEKAEEACMLRWRSERFKRLPVCLAGIEPKACPKDVTLRPIPPLRLR